MAHPSVEYYSYWEEGLKGCLWNIYWERQIQTNLLAHYFHFTAHSSGYVFVCLGLRKGKRRIQTRYLFHIGYLFQGWAEEGLQNLNISLGTSLLSLSLYFLKKNILRGHSSHNLKKCSDRKRIKLTASYSQKHPCLEVLGVLPSL